MRSSRTLLALALRFAVLFGVLATFGCTARAQAIILVDPFPSLSFSSPVELKDAADGTNRLYVVEQQGRIRTFINDTDTETITTFLNITDRVASGGEMGLLGLAFDPDYAANGYLYLDYTTSSPRRTRISRFTRSAENPLEADPASELILMEVNQPFGNHNAGAIAFGPPEGPEGERYLYVTLGDGGSGNDPDNNGQRPETLLGSILRLDVHDHGEPLDCAAETGAATIPPDNPLADGPGDVCDEAYAYGFRNPWRMTFDEPTGQFWIGDVGQSAWEEIDILEAGGNFGWRPYEGTHCILGPCEPEGKTFPVWEYPHSNGNFSITGGFVYRGEAIPELEGQYVYGDLGGRIWALDTSGIDPVNTELGSVDPLCSDAYCLTSWGRDEAGELYALVITGEVRKLLRNPPVEAEPPPAAGPAGLSVDGANPFHGHTTLRLSADGPARVAVYDLLGREVAVLFEGTLRASTPRTVAFDAARLPAGVYLARLEAGAVRQTVPLTVLR